MTMVPALPVRLTAALTTSLSISPTVQITLSASWPRVRLTMVSCASSGPGNACVAPNSIACSRLNSAGSIAMMCLPPAYLAPCTAFMPTPPVPKITTVSPGRTSPALVAEQNPVVTPQLTSAASSNGTSSSIFTQDHSDSTGYWANEPTTHIPPRSSSPSWKRKVPSTRQPMAAFLPASHRFCCPVEQYRQGPPTGVEGEGHRAAALTLV